MSEDAVQGLQKWVQGSLQALADFSANEAKRLDKVEKQVVSSRDGASAAERKLSELEAEGARRRQAVERELGALRAQLGELGELREVVRAKPSVAFLNEALAKARDELRDEQAQLVARSSASAELLSHAEERFNALMARKLQELEGDVRADEQRFGALRAELDGTRAELGARSRALEALEGSVRKDEERAGALRGELDATRVGARCSSSSPRRS